MEFHLFISYGNKEAERVVSLDSLDDFIEFVIFLYSIGVTVFHAEMLGSSSNVTGSSSNVTGSSSNS